MNLKDSSYIDALKNMPTRISVKRKPLNQKIKQSITILSTNQVVVSIDCYFLESFLHLIHFSRKTQEIQSNLG